MSDQFLADINTPFFMEAENDYEMDCDYIEFTPENLLKIHEDILSLEADREAARETDRYEAEFGADGTRVRGNHDPKQFSAATKRMFQEITDLKEIKDSGKHVVMCHYPIPFFRASFASTAFMLYGHVHQTIEYEYIAKLRREVKANSTGYGTPNGNFINVGCMMPYMDYTPRTLDEIIPSSARWRLDQ